MGKVRGILLKIFCYMISGCLVFLITGCCFMDSLLFPAPHTGRRIGTVVLDSNGAKLDAVWRKGSPEKSVILYSHGNGEHLVWMRSTAEQFSRHGYGILLYDYAGYGGSTGNAGEEQACHDIESAYRYLTEVEKIAPDRIVVFGFSVGSGPSCYLAEKYPVKALVLAAPFASASQVLLPFSVPFDRFPNVERVEKMEIPLLVIHGTEDDVIPYRNGRKVFERAKTSRKRFVSVKGAKHNDLFYKMGETLFVELERFLQQIKSTGAEK